MQEGVADLFVDPNRTSLNASAAAAGYHGVLPGKFVLTGHSAGGGLAAAAGGFYSDAVTPEDNDLLGVVMYDGVSSNGTFASALSESGRPRHPDLPDRGTAAAVERQRPDHQGPGGAAARASSSASCSPTARTSTR